MPIIILGIALAIFVIYWKSPKARGKRGEATVKLFIGETVPGEKYIINDIIIKDENGKTSQIDHIVINRNGIFVIETKNYSGRIYGNETQQEWTQVLQYGKVKNKFYNPVKQNATHVRRIKEATNTQIPIYSLIVFTKGNVSYIDAPNVYTLGEMKRKLNSPTNVLLTQSEMENLYNQLCNIKNNCTVTTKEHIENIHKTQTDINKGICPRCNGKLIRRKGKYGDFYGCSNYPKCKFTKEC